MGDTIPAWVITNQTETNDVGPDGQYVSGVRVMFRTATGVVGSVFVPHTDYRPDRVRQLVGAKAEIADAIAAMQG